MSSEISGKRPESKAEFILDKVRNLRKVDKAELYVDKVDFDKAWFQRAETPGAIRASSGLGEAHRVLGVGPPVEQAVGSVPSENEKSNQQCHWYIQECV